VTHTLATAVVAAQARWDRKPADFYPTPFDATVALLDFLQLPAGTKVLEPACGEGHMSRVMALSGLEVESLDLRTDSGYGEQGADFLAGRAHTADWVITNPPFNVAEGFIRRALEITPNVAMLVKATYFSAAGRIPLAEETTPEWKLDLTWRPAFLEAERGSSPIMEVCWMVWTAEYSEPHYKVQATASPSSPPSAPAASPECQHQQGHAGRGGCQ
jgi:hypothetical protein